MVGYTLFVKSRTANARALSYLEGETNPSISHQNNRQKYRESNFTVPPSTLEPPSLLVLYILFWCLFVLCLFYNIQGPAFCWNIRKRTDCAQIHTCVVRARNLKASHQTMVDIETRVIVKLHVSKGHALGSW